MDMREKVCVQGLGFVGLAMATVVANVSDEDGNLCYSVVGIDLPKNDILIESVNNGILPFKTEDISFSKLLNKAVNENHNLIATSDEKCLSQAEIVIVDVQLSISKCDKEDYNKYHLHKESIEKAILSLGKLVKPDCLILVETTIPPGFCRNIIYPLLISEFSKRGISSEPLLAYSYERVMPGKDYLNSIKNFFRTYSGLNREAAEKAKNFLSSVIDTNIYPLKEELEPEACEMAKVLENSYRAMNIAFIYEWTLFAEKAGINIFSVIDGIRQRPTHRNIMMPGLGVGGYCLTKDSLLALWANDNYFHSSYGFPFSIEALKVNDKMPLHVIDLIEQFTTIADKRVLILGVSYREDIGDTRFSPTEILYNALIEKGAKISVNDPYIFKWNEVPDAVFVDDFSNFDIVIFATRHKDYLSISEKELLKMTENTELIVDANNIISDMKAFALLDNGRKVVGVGKGHINSKNNQL